MRLSLLLLLGASALVEKHGPFTRGNGKVRVELDALTSLEVLEAETDAGDAAWTSGSVWPSGAALAIYLWEQHNDTARPLEVLELACGGSALPGLAMALRGHAVTFAELPQVLEHTRTTVSHNLQRASSPGETTFEAFAWSHKAIERSFDLVIGSDICYSPEHVGDIARWVREIGAEALIAGEDRSGTFTKLKEAMVADGHRVARVPLPKWFERTGKHADTTPVEIIRVEAASRGAAESSAR